MTNEELQAIKARAEAATPGPWSKAWMWDYRVTGDGVFALGEGPTTYGATLAHAAPQAERDAAFIAAARADVPALVAEVERLRAIVDAAPEYAAYVYMALATFDTPMSLEEFYVNMEVDLDGAE